MAKAPAFQLYASDFDMDTASWDNEEVGIYFRLLMYQWVNGSIPSDIKRLSKISRMGQKRFQNRWQIISQKFQKKNENELVNPRMEKTREEQDNYRKLQSEAGKRGVEKKREMGLYPFNDPSSNPSTDPSTEKQALQSSSSPSSFVPLKKDESFRLPSQEEISESSILKLNEDLDKITYELYSKGIFPKVYSFKNKMLKDGKNERAIIHTLSRCYLKKKFKNDDPWAYCTQIINIEDGNFNEREYHKTSK